jgi:hypothetical protein
VLGSIVLVDAGELLAGRSRLPPRAATWKATRRRLTAYTHPPPPDLEPTAQIHPTAPVKFSHIGQHKQPQANILKSPVFFTNCKPVLPSYKTHTNQPLVL